MRDVDVRLLMSIAYVVVLTPRVRWASRWCWGSARRRWASCSWSAGTSTTGTAVVGRGALVGDGHPGPAWRDESGWWASPTLHPRRQTDEGHRRGASTSGLSWGGIAGWCDATWTAFNNGNGTDPRPPSWGLLGGCGGSPADPV